MVEEGVTQDVAEALADLFPPKITDYWDANQDAIPHLASAIGAIEPAARALALVAVWDGIAEHAQALTDDQLVSAGICLAEDLYRAASARIRDPAAARAWYAAPDDAVLDYLRAVGPALLEALRARGYVLHYLVDSRQDDVLTTYAHGEWFRAAGFKHVHTQEAALGLMQELELPASAFHAAWPALAEDARGMVATLITRCLEKGEHYTLFDGDPAEGSFDAALAQRGQPGIITAFRTEPPGRESRVQVWMAAGVRTPASGPPHAT